MTDDSDTFPDLNAQQRSYWRQQLARLRAFLSGRQTAYMRTFNNPAAEPVLTDLARFCRATESTFHPDPRMAAQLDGRREVWLRIQQHLRLSPEELYELATRQVSDKLNN